MLLASLRVCGAPPCFCLSRAHVCICLASPGLRKDWTGGGVVCIYLEVRWCAVAVRRDGFTSLPPPPVRLPE